MSRRHSILFGFIVLFLTSLACNAFAPSGTEPGLDIPPPAVTDLTNTPETQVVDGLAPTATLPSNEPIVDENGNQASARMLVDLNVRKGPGVQYDRVGFLLANETVPIMGRDPVTGWWKIVCPSRIDEVTECWISGGAQYVTVSNTDGVPVAAVPPTPTPVPTVTPTSTPEDGVVADQGNGSNSAGFVIYAAADGLFQANLDMSQSPPMLEEGAQLTAVSDIGDVLVSPNGQYVAYTVGQAGTQALRLINLATGADTLLVRGADLDTDTTDSIGTVVDNIVWLESSDGLLFNTSVFNLTGPGFGSAEDLQRVTLSGQRSELLEAGAFAGVFTLAGNQVIGGSSDAMLRTTINGSEVTTLFDFPMINTASEYIFYPLAQWIDGNTAYVAVPDAEPFETGQFSVWQVSASGTAVQGATLPGLALFDSVLWSPNGSRVAFLDHLSEPNTPFMMIANGDGRNALAYDSGSNLQLYAWSGNGRSVLYSGNGFYAASIEGDSPAEFLVADAVTDMQWVNNETFIAIVGANGQWNLTTNNLSGQSKSSAPIRATQILFDIWTP